VTAFTFGILTHTRRHTSADGFIQTARFLRRSLTVSNVQYKTLHVDVSLTL